MSPSLQETARRSISIIDTKLVSLRPLILNKIDIPSDLANTISELKSLNYTLIRALNADVKDWNLELVLNKKPLKVSLQGNMHIEVAIAYWLKSILTRIVNETRE